MPKHKAETPTEMPVPWLHSWSKETSISEAKPLTCVMVTASEHNAAWKSASVEVTLESPWTWEETVSPPEDEQHCTGLGRRSH